MGQWEMDKLKRYSYRDRLEEIYQFIIEYKTAYDGNSPGVTSIERKTGIVKSQIVKYLRVLEKEGYIKLIHPGRYPIQIVVTNGFWQLRE